MKPTGDVATWRRRVDAAAHGARHGAEGLGLMAQVDAVFKLGATL